jgi:hypothetical protein
MERVKDKDNIPYAASLTAVYLEAHLGICEVGNKSFNKVD